MANVAISGDTSGAVTLSAPAVAGTTTLTLPTTSGTVLTTGSTFGGTGPAFSAYRSGANQNVTTNTWTKVQLNAEDFDTANCFDSSTNYRFTPNVAGYYLISGCVSSASASYAQNIWTSLYKNGSPYRTAALSFSSEIINTSGPVVTAVIYFNGSTDYVELYGNNLASVSPAFGGSTYYTFLSGALVRSA